MSTAQVVNDGLWLCLCPNSVFPRFQRPVLATPGLRTLQRTTRTHHRRSAQTRSTPTYQAPWPLQSIRPCKNHRLLHDGFFQSRPNVEYEAGGVGLHETYETLRYSSRRLLYMKVHALVEYLVKKCGERPNLRMYEALILANAQAEYGSASEVSKLLQEMADAGIKPDSATYHAALRALAVHPDHLLRTHILSSLRERWFSLTREGHHDLVAGLIRERQLESAIRHLENMRADETRIYSWLYDMLIYALCDVGEFDEPVRLMQQRLDQGELMISGTVWYYLLDTASRALHHAGTVFVYNARIATSYLNPPSGMCNDILNCAARHGDTRLATAVFSKLSGRSGNPIQLQHYEALVETYTAAGDLRSALTLLCAVLSAGHPLTESSTRPIFIYLKHSRHQPTTAMDILEDLRDQGRRIPLAALNTVLQAYIHHSNLPGALHLYNSINLYTSSHTTQKPHKSLAPNTTTFNSLLRGCTQGRDKSKAMFLASEMVALKVKPDALTYDRLVLVCLNSDKDLADAWRYVEEMREWGFVMRGGTAVALARRACELRDENVWDLDKKRGGLLETGRIDQLIDEHWGKGAEKMWAEEEREDATVEDKTGFD